ncbi:MAG TPA: hypothetical protein VNZ26_29630, partial [Vicinamibacterales bacterium]|nr:hypothetical protein [Vicinamibacterales bacterium]
HGRILEQHGRHFFDFVRRECEAILLTLKEAMPTNVGCERKGVQGLLSGGPNEPQPLAVIRECHTTYEISGGADD